MNQLIKFVDKIKAISKKCDAIHHNRKCVRTSREYRQLKIGKIIRKEIPDIPITVSLRVRDKNEGLKL